MSFHIATSIRFCGESIIRIVSFHHGGIVRIGLGYFKTSFHIKYPGGFIVVATLARVCGDYLSVSSESTQRYHVAHIIVAEASGLNSCTPLRELASASIIAIAGGVPLCVRYGGRQVVVTFPAASDTVVVVLPRPSVRV